MSKKKRSGQGPKPVQRPHKWTLYRGKRVKVTETTGREYIGFYQEDVTFPKIGKTCLFVVTDERGRGHQYTHPTMIAAIELADE